MSSPTDQPLTCKCGHLEDVHDYDQGCQFPKCTCMLNVEGILCAALALLQSQFDNLRRDKEEGDRQNVLTLAGYRKEVAAHAETQRINDELREALKDKQRGMTFTESERNAELVRQVTETRERLEELSIENAELSRRQQFTAKEVGEALGIDEAREQLVQAQNALRSLRDSCLRIARLVSGSSKELLRQSIVDADAALRAKPEPEGTTKEKA